jgi:uncharacterized protein involved in exopolysaccharide biosynthesis
VVGEDDLEKFQSNVTSVPKVSELKEEIEKLREQVRKLKESTYISVSDYQLNLQRLQTQMDIVKKLLVTLVNEYEMAKAQEMKEQVSFQVLDPPYIPDERKPYKPKKKLMIAVALVSGLFLGVFAAFFKEWLDNVRKRYREDESNA